MGTHGVPQALRPSHLLVASMVATLGGALQAIPVGATATLVATGTEQMDDLDSTLARPRHGRPAPFRRSSGMSMPTTTVATVIAFARSLGQPWKLPRSASRKPRSSSLETTSSSTTAH